MRRDTAEAIRPRGLFFDSLAARFAEKRIAVIGIGRVVSMKLYIITAPDNITEGWQYAHSLASLAIMLENGGFKVRTIEEVPRDTPIGDLPGQVFNPQTWPKE